NEPTVAFHPPGPPSTLMDALVASSVVMPGDWDKLPGPLRDDRLSCRDYDELLPHLVKHRLLTEYQARRIAAGTTFGLILGNYRVLERLGAGGMGVVFRAEHIR